MTPESEAELYARHPRLLVYPPGQGPDLPMHHGIECGDGWLTLIDCLLATAQIRTGSDGNPPVVLQIKQKFGELRVYWRESNETVCGMTWLAARLSQHICEVCGQPGALLAEWPRSVRTRCEVHRGIANPDNPRLTTVDQRALPSPSAAIELTDKELQDAALLLAMDRGELTVADLQRRFKLGYRRAKALLAAVTALRTESGPDSSG